MAPHYKNGLDMDAPDTWPESYRRAHAYGQPSSRWCCVDRLSGNPPTQPGQVCRNGHPLPWYDPDNPERGFFDADDDGRGEE